MLTNPPELAQQKSLKDGFILPFFLFNLFIIYKIAINPLENIAVSTRITLESWFFLIFD